MAAAGLALVPGPRASGADACARFGPMTTTGALADARLVELSGVAASRRHSGVLWAHNDSGGAAEVYALGLDGSARGAYPVGGASAVDWEDMAVGPGPGSGSFLYLGDIGDNGAERGTVTVYRVPEPAAAPAAPGASLGTAVKIDLRYPGGSADAEALLVDPRSGDLVIVTKALSGTSRVLVAPASALKAGATVTMTDAGTIKIPLPTSGGSGLPGTMVTGGDVSPDGSTVVLRTYRSVLVYPRGSGSVATALKGKACFGPQAQEPQGEAVAFTRDGGSLVTISEGARSPVHRSGAPAAGTTTTTRPGGGGPGTTRAPAGAGGGGSTTTSDATTTTTDGTTTTTREGASSTSTTDEARGSEGGGDEVAGEAAGSTSPDGGDLNPLLIVLPLAVLAGGGALWWARRRGSASG